MKTIAVTRLQVGPEMGDFMMENQSKRICRRRVWSDILIALDGQKIRALQNWPLKHINSFQLGLTDVDAWMRAKTILR